MWLIKFLFALFPLGLLGFVPIYMGYTNPVLIGGILLVGLRAEGLKSSLLAKSWLVYVDVVMSIVALVGVVIAQMQGYVQPSDALTLTLIALGLDALSGPILAISQARRDLNMS